MTQNLLWFGLSSDFHLFVGFFLFFFVEIVAFNSNTPLGKAGRNGSLSASGGVRIMERHHKFIFSLHLFTLCQACLQKFVPTGFVFMMIARGGHCLCPPSGSGPLGSKRQRARGAKGWSQGLLPD